MVYGTSFKGLTNLKTKVLEFDQSCAANQMLAIIHYYKCNHCSI